MAGTATKGYYAESLNEKNEALNESLHWIADKSGYR